MPAESTLTQRPAMRRSRMRFISVRLPSEAQWLKSF
jgi:hypothetical protein